MTITVKRAEGLVEFCTDLELRADWEAAVAALEAAESTDERLGNVGSAEAAQRVQELEHKMQAATLLFRLRGLPRRRWQELGEEHPPREGNQQDAAMGVDVSTFFDAVALESILAVNEKTTNNVVDFDARAEWADLADDMTDGQYRDFVNVILSLNRAVNAAPFSLTASRVMQPSEQSSS